MDIESSYFWEAMQDLDTLLTSEPRTMCPVLEQGVGDSSLQLVLDNA